MRMIRFLAVFLAASSLWAQGPMNFRYVYDDVGQLIKVIDSTGIVIEYVYDRVGNILEVKRSTLPSPDALTIFNFTPQEGPTLASVTVQGQGFSSTTSGNVVKFNGTDATVLSASPTTLLVTV